MSKPTDPAYKNLSTDEAVTLEEAEVIVDAVPQMEVVAPATLPEGYKFDVDLDGKNFQVTVVCQLLL